MTPSVLMVSKPIVPPFNDSSKNLVKDIVLGTDRVRFTVLTAGDFTFERSHIRQLPIYREAGSLAPSAGQNARVVSVLLRRGLGDIHHFFFGPNPRTARVIRWLRRLRHPPSIHTICSVPRDFENVHRCLFADVHVALSRYTQHQLTRRGVREVRHIPPCIPPIEPLFDEVEQQRLRRSFGLPDDRPMVLYPGDYDFSRTVFTVAEAARLLEATQSPVTWVFACRLKHRQGAAIEKEVQRMLSSLIDLGRAFFFRHVPRMLDLIGACDLVVLPAETTYAKMDLPLVLLESMALGRPVVVAEVPPLDELPVSEGGWWVRPHQPGALAEVISDALGDSKERIRRGRRGAQVVSERYRRDLVAQQYIDLYRACLG